MNNGKETRSKSSMDKFRLSAICSWLPKKEAALPDNLVNFETTSQGIAATENSLSFKVKLSRNTDQSIPGSR